MIDQQVTLSVSSGQTTNEIRGWKSVRITRGIERMPSDFEFVMTDPSLDPSTIPVDEGMEFVVFIGEETVVSGYVDRPVPSIGPTGGTITVSGRGFCSDLVDCSAVWQGCQFINQTIEQIAVSVTNPYPNINVICDNPGAPIPVYGVNLGESPFSILSKICRIRPSLCFENEEGDLVLTQAGSTQASGGIVYGVNVEHASFLRSMDQRFSNYIVVSQGVTSFLDQGIQPLSLYEATDDTVTRPRIKYIDIETGDANFNVAKAMAQWEANRRLGRSRVITVTVKGWHDAAGVLWTPNTLVYVDIPQVKASALTMLISEVTYTLGIEGTHCTMQLMPPEAFAIEPIINNPVPLDLAQAYTGKL